MNYKSILRRAAALLCGMALLSAPALANVSKDAEQDTEPAEIIETAPVSTPTPTPVIEETSDQPFTVVGNGEIIDDISDGSKEFYTISTANNNQFFIVVDKSRASENVYMLAKVDEDDIAEFIEGWTEPTPTPAPTLLIRQPTATPTPQVITAEPEEAEISINPYLLVGGAAALMMLAGWYFKVHKKDAYENDDEGMEYDDSEDADE